VTFHSLSHQAAKALIAASKAIRLRMAQDRALVFFAPDTAYSLTEHAFSTALASATIKAMYYQAIAKVVSAPLSFRLIASILALSLFARPLAEDR